jgi:hypothetical protein
VSRASPLGRRDLGERVRACRSDVVGKPIVRDPEVDSVVLHPAHMTAERAPIFRRSSYAPQRRKATVS